MPGKACHSCELGRRPASRFFWTLPRGHRRWCDQAGGTHGVFTPNSARAFRVTGQTGTFIALNDGVAGFNASTDSILHLSSYTIGGTNTVTLV